MVIGFIYTLAFFTSISCLWKGRKLWKGKNIGASIGTYIMSIMIVMFTVFLLLGIKY